ncbi:hypothetical protein [Mesorhizobium mediterraneum]|uniref:hypothetical protein n=1 Tax=Mesorhizobium mediterraneum TaxID=43617 RepID=UPI0017873CD9|nr:hypothetical protein [Mesorhizobium mediterraneum]
MAEDDMLDRRKRCGRGAQPEPEALDVFGFDEPQPVGWRMVDNQPAASAKHSS